MRSLLLVIGIIITVLGWIGLIYDGFIPISDFGAGFFYFSHLVILIGVILLIVGYLRLPHAQSKS